MKRKMFVLGIDGMPCSLMKSSYIKKVMPYFSNLCEENGLKKMNSVYPVVSSVAWTTFSTGMNPGEHGIFGFVDRNPDPFEIKIPTTIDRKKKPIWSQLSPEKKKVVINVPLTYPPEPLNGYMVSCFLCPSISKLTYPTNFYKYLLDIGYVIDVDANIAKENRVEFIRQLIKIMDKRFILAFDMLSSDWDYFQLHIMETDRLMHFCFEYLQRDKGDVISKLVQMFFEKLDKWIEKLVNLIQEKSSIIILSDHGFCKIKSEVQLNVWLEQKNLLILNSNRKIEDYDSKSICYSLSPGRIYLNLEGREERGSVKYSEYNYWRKIIKENLLQLNAPNSNEKIIDKVMYKEEIYSGDNLRFAPDIIVHPKNGYDIKASLDGNSIFTHSALTGMHTYEDALILGVNVDVSNVKSIEQVYQVIRENT